MNPTRSPSDTRDMVWDTDSRTWKPSVEECGTPGIEIEVDLDPPAAEVKKSAATSPQNLTAEKREQ